MHKENLQQAVPDIVQLTALTPGEREELTALGMLSEEGLFQSAQRFDRDPGYCAVGKQAIGAPSVLNEACEYSPIPSAFSRGQRVDLGDFSLLFISGTASVDENGSTVHAGDFRAQCWRAYRNITALLQSAGGTWHDVVRCTCYLRDIERDYQDFNVVRNGFFRWLGLNPLPASVGVQARLCREDLLVEMDAFGVLKRERD